jgi:hypothetical protein
MLDSPTTHWPRCRIVARRLGDCELLSKIGSGGMAEVWMARKGKAGGVSKAVAVKLMSGALAADPRYRRMFLEEARVSMMLTHSNIVQVFDVGQEGDQGYLVMEWVDGLNLAQIGECMRESNSILPLVVTAHIIGELARALGYAHNVTNEGAPVGVVHRDISPQNVLISVSGEVKLTDFGVARVAHEDTSGLHVKGKLRYMAPEQLAGHGSAATVDLYALGAVLHELLDGRKFRDDADDLFTQAVGGVVPDLANPDIPRELDDLRLALLEPVPKRRLQSAEEVLERLGSWPGYRNAAADLAKVCRQQLGVKAPRSGLFPHTDAETGASTWKAIASQPEAEAVPTQTAETRAQVDEPATPAPGVEVAATHTFHPDATTMPMPPRRVGTRRRIAILGAGVMVCVVGGVGLAVSRQMTSEEPARVSPPLAVERSKSEPRPEPAEVAVPLLPVARDAATSTPAEPPVVPEPMPPEPEGRAEAAPHPSSVKRASTEDASKSKDASKTKDATQEPKPRARPRKVAVRFLLDGPQFAYVRVDRGRVFPLEPLAKTKISAGRHTLFWRLSEKDPWHDGGVFDFEPGHDYDVDVSETGLRLSKR